MRKEKENREQTNETEKSFNELKEITQALQEQKERTLTPTLKTAHKTEPKPPSNITDAKKSVLEPIGS
ncbi:hypothetical protein [Helicobacter pylori]|uniref:hypothetical protein n=1 Tax=Helicobacter pylori TaxID=210 RepID=UPI0009AE24F0|nr:hypothetical protein [Helicobacter pylori]MUU22525.1 hypothetical protein [Helicobacter pylori]MUU37353.1 hypothetical protein [Helicobacter pylori]MUU46517.1 hypothetical protein [Helicobacter pylori]